MHTFTKRFVLAGLALVLIATTAGAGEGVWIAKDGERHEMHGNAIFISEDGAERFDLADLADGETRTFGSGPRAVTVTRVGDAATISRFGSGDDFETIDITCQLGEDTCTVLTFSDDAEKVMVAIEKVRSCVGGGGDCDHAFGPHGAGHVVVKIDCDGDDCEDLAELHQMRFDGVNGGHRVIQVEATDGEAGELAQIVIRGLGEVGDFTSAEGNVFVTSSTTAIHGKMLRHFDGVLLRCPEGDATLSVTKEEADDVFLCPKHSSPLEKVERRGHFGSGYRVIHRGTGHDE